LHAIVKLKVSSYSIKLSLLQRQIAIDLELACSSNQPNHSHSSFPVHHNLLKLLHYNLLDNSYIVISVL